MSDSNQSTGSSLSVSERLARGIMSSTPEKDAGTREVADRLLLDISGLCVAVDGVQHSTKGEAELDAYDLGGHLQAEKDQVHREAEDKPEQHLPQNTVCNSSEIDRWLWERVPLEGDENERKEDREPDLRVRRDSAVAQQWGGNKHAAGADENEEESPGEGRVEL